MPIRIDQDDNDNGSNFNPGNRPGFNRGGGGGGGGFGGLGILLMFLPQLIRFLFRNPKIGILVVVALVAFWFFSGKSCSLPGSSAANSSSYSKGCDMKREVYDQAPVYEPLADNVKDPLPERVSLLEFAPPRLNQGKQGSCVAWASSYAARTILQSRATGQRPEQIRFSPSFLYSQIALENCQGAYLQRAMEAMQQRGGLPLSQFPYDENTCSNEPSDSEFDAAAKYKIKGASRLSKNDGSGGDDDYRVNMLAIKQNLAQGAPVVIGMRVGGSFMRSMEGKEVWFPEKSDFDAAFTNEFGGHAMCVIGYDDYMKGGAFQIMNSWGNDWGKEGVCWVRYNDFDYFVVEAYGLHPMGAVSKPAPTTLDCFFGLENQSTKSAIAFTARGKSGNVGVYRTTSPVVKGQSKDQKGTPFKIQFTNNAECYTYLIGLETDKTSYVLFPYTPKHSPYCGITGKRLFPKDHTLYPDNVGTMDEMAVLVTNEPIDYKAVNQQVSAAKGATLADKINAALGTKLTAATTFSSEGGNVKFTKPVSDAGWVAVVLEVEKR